MKKRIRTALLVFFSATLILSVFMLSAYYIEGYLQKKQTDALLALKQEASTPRPTIQPEENPEPQPDTPQEPALVTVTHPKTGEQVSLLPDFAELFTQNPDIVGWLSIPGTDISYPVMQTPNKPNYYLRRGFDKKYSTRGCLYAREECDVFAPTDNVTIYGHRMRDGSMFAQLERFKTQQFQKENPYIYFDTLTELHTYEVFAVFLTTATQGEGFAYHSFIQAASPEEFDTFVENCRSLSMYNTGIVPQYGDKLITLSTCDYFDDNGRLVVVARRVG